MDDYIKKLEEENKILRDKLEAAEKKSEDSLFIAMDSIRIIRHQISWRYEKEDKLSPEEIADIEKSPAKLYKVTRGDKKKIKNCIDRLISSPYNEPLWVGKPFVGAYLDKKIEEHMVELVEKFASDYSNYEISKTP